MYCIVRLSDFPKAVEILIDLNAVETFFILLKNLSLASSRSNSSSSPAIVAHVSTLLVKLLHLTSSVSLLAADITNRTLLTFAFTATKLNE